MRRIACLFAVAWLASALPAQAEILRGLTSANQILTFDSGSPGTVSSVSITGLTGGDSLISIDQRPANGVLYGFAVNGAFGRLYSINAATGLASLKSTLSTAPNGTFFDIDFNPTVDRLRVVSDAGQNLRVNVDTGATIVDGALQFDPAGPNAGTPAGVVAAAYSNNVGNATTTRLYDLDLSTQSLLLQSPPNAGTLAVIGSLSGFLDAEAAFDISGITGLAYAVLNGFELSQVNLATGETTSLGFINTGASVIGLAAPTAVPEPGTGGLLLAAVALAAFRRRSRAVGPRVLGVASC